MDPTTLSNFIAAHIGLTYRDFADAFQRDFDQSVTVRPLNDRDFEIEAFGESFTVEFYGDTKAFLLSPTTQKAARARAEEQAELDADKLYDAVTKAVASLDKATITLSNINESLKPSPYAGPSSKKSGETIQQLFARILARKKGGQ